VLFLCNNQKDLIFVDVGNLLSQIYVNASVIYKSIHKYSISPGLRVKGSDHRWFNGDVGEFISLVFFLSSVFLLSRGSSFHFFSVPLVLSRYKDKYFIVFVVVHSYLSGFFLHFGYRFLLLIHLSFAFFIPSY